MRNSFIIFICLLLCPVLGSQNLNFKIETVGVSSLGKYSPFWFTANRYGVSSVENNWYYLRAGVVGGNSLGKSVKLDYGFDMVTGDGLTSKAYVQQLYVDISWRWLRLAAGQKERAGILKNSHLSTGSLTESANARPVPQVRLEIPDYVDFFKTNGWFKLKAHIAYGYYTDGGWQKKWVAPETRRTSDVLYHSKSLFFKIGNEKKFPLTYEGGLEMATQFGGYCYDNKLVNNGAKTKMPSSFTDFFKALIPLAGGEESLSPDQLNIAGNMLGSWHAALTWQVPGWTLKGYYEHAFEDHSQMFLEYGAWTEQLVGLELNVKNFRYLHTVVVEYFNLKNQSGSVYHDTTTEIPDQISAVDNNYNHHSYGWFNYGMTAGTPLATSPIYNADNSMQIYNNRVEAFHLALMGYPLDQWQYRLLFTKTNNWGTYDSPYKEIKSSLSGLLEITYSPQWLKGLSLSAAVAADKGTQMGNNLGGMLTMKFEGDLLGRLVKGNF